MEERGTEEEASRWKRGPAVRPRMGRASLCFVWGNREQNFGITRDRYEGLLGILRHIEQSLSIKTRTSGQDPRSDMSRKL